MFRKRKRATRIDRRADYARHRIDNLANHSLFEWVDQCVYTYGKAMAEAQEAGDPQARLDLLSEAEVAARIMTDIAIALQSRYEVDMMGLHEDRQRTRPTY